METLKKARTVLRSSVKRACNRIAEILNSESLEDQDYEELDGLVPVLEQRFQDLSVKDGEILNLLLEEDEEDDSKLDSEQKKVDEYSALYFKCRSMVSKVQKVKQPQEENNSVCSGTGVQRAQAMYKLPALKLMQFSGHLGDWLPFWSQFEKIHLDETMAPADKLGYLSMSVTPNSPVEKLVRSYPATGENYPAVIAALEARFGRKDLLTEYYIRELLKLILHNISSEKKYSVAELHDLLQCHLRNLESLGVTASNGAPILMPLVSSCLPAGILQVWERNSSTEQRITSEDNLKSIMDFLKREVESAQKMELAKSSFGLQKTPEKSFIIKKDLKPRYHTAAALVSTGLNNVTCVFCEKGHCSSSCDKVKSLTMQERRECLKSHRACFICLKNDGHRAYQCKVRHLKCSMCDGNHYDFLCSAITRKSSESSEKVLQNINLSAIGTHCNVAMQTLVVNLVGKDYQKPVRVLLDTGSQKSYVSMKCVTEVGYLPIHQESVRHVLFGGAKSEIMHHDVYHINLSSQTGKYQCNFDVLGQEIICGAVPSAPNGQWIQELANKNIKLSDMSSESDVDILLGSDVCARLWTGKRVELACGLVAMETSLGWTLSGKIPHAVKKSGISFEVTDLFVREAPISDLWTLDVLGIRDPTEKMLQADIDQATREHFLSTVKVDKDNRFEVRLPFVANHPPLSENYALALSRLESTQKKLQNDGYMDAYVQVLENWKDNGVIEEVPYNKVNDPGHYLPHRHVIKEGSTTAVRPVFDASAKVKGKYSLNECLEKGPNLIEKIPSSLARFREKKVGISGDIEKAFLQISVSPKDRNFLRFLWKTADGELKVYRHCRVVFGVSPSPFLLEPTINLHLQTVEEKCKVGSEEYNVKMLELLQNSFYVDNCLVSVDNENVAKEFKDTASSVMMERKFNLRGWELSGQPDEGKPTNVLGLWWHKFEDTLGINVESLTSMQCNVITKKTLLSAAHRLFDPLGLVSSVALVPKLLVQDTWRQNMGWTDEVDDDVRNIFLKWLQEIPLLGEVKIQRWIGISDSTMAELHVFSDACKTSYAAVIFLRVQTGESVHLHLLASKARVAPTSKSKVGMTIPRLELLAALIAARLYTTVVEDYKLKDVKTTFWTDATTVLAWLAQSDSSWDVYVRNRVLEIRQLTESCTWRHVPGELNPADLPSRGCTPKKFVKSRWWEGPQWLLDNPVKWPQEEPTYNHDEIQSELRKTVVSAPVSIEVPDTEWYKYFSSYTKLVRMVAWMQRFKNNAVTKKRTGRLPEPQDLTADEFKSAELTVFRIIQGESPTEMKKMECSQIINEEGLVRLKTKICYRNDDRDFCYPIVLPASHPVVQRMVLSVHQESCHTGSQTLLAILRQKYWLIGGRRAIRSILNTCIVCKRYSARKVQAEAIPLPEPRVRDARTFEVTRVDLAGPLFVKNDRDELMKVWVCVFTCAVYRAVRLELVWSLSTDSFTQALRRFISRGGRPEIIYSDNGTNFTGFYNVSRKLNWDEIAKYCTTKKIEWRFNPPSAPWWGGFWERLIGILKPLLKKVLRSATVSCEELLTILSDCEAVINSRPISYMSEEKSDLSFLTPNMFLHDLQESGVPEYDTVTTTGLTKRHKYRQEVVYELRKRFRVEYLGQLQLLSKKSDQRPLEAGEMVLIGDDNVRRVSWPVGRIEELITGKDNQVRVVKVRTAHGMMVRPVQRIYRLEIEAVPGQSKPEMIQSDNHVRSYDPVVTTSQSSQDKEELLAYVGETKSSPIITRKGRHVKKPLKLDL